jgi:hypothetical protein
LSGTPRASDDVTYFNESLFGEFLVDLGSVGDILGTVGVVQCGHGFFDVAQGRRYGGYDGSLGAATQ